MITRIYTSPFATMLPNVVFTTSINITDITKGSARIPIDLASKVAKYLDVDPVFIDATLSCSNDYMAAFPRGIIVSINLSSDLLSQFKRNGRMLTIGCDNYDGYPDIEKTQIGLYPVFKEKTAPPSEQLAIDYTCTPSRQFEKSTAAGRDKTIAVYFRHPNPQSDIFSVFCRHAKYLSQNHGYKFLMSTGSATSHSMNAQFESLCTDLPYAEFCNYNKLGQQKSSTILDDYFSRATAIWTTDDTISTLSDAVSTGLPVSLITLGDTLQKFLTRNAFDDQNRKLQLALIREGRLSILTDQSRDSHWAPVRRDEWGAISKRIANEVRAKQSSLPPEPH